MEETSVWVPIYKRDHSRNQAPRNRNDVFSCLTSLNWQTICRTLSIILLPGLILFGGITVFITGCLKNIPPLIIGGAIMFVFGILFCLLCGQVCDGLTKRRLKQPRRSRDETSSVVV